MPLRTGLCAYEAVQWRMLTRGRNHFFRARRREGTVGPSPAPPTLLEHVHWEAEARWTNSWSKRIQPHSWTKRLQLEQWLLVDGCLRHNCNVASVDYAPSSITRGNIKENTAHKQALGITDITSSFTSLWKTHREKGLCGLPPTSSYFQLIEELALCPSADRKCSWFADMLRLRNPGLHLSTWSDWLFLSHREEPVFFWPPLLSASTPCMGWRWFTLAPGPGSLLPLHPSHTKGSLN